MFSGCPIPVASETRERDTERYRERQRETQRDRERQREVAKQPLGLDLLRGANTTDGLSRESESNLRNEKLVGTG